MRVRTVGLRIENSTRSQQSTQFGTRIKLECVAVCFSVLQCVEMCCNVSQCVAACCSVLQCAAVCCSVLQYAAVCCSVLQCVEDRVVHMEVPFSCSVLQSVSVPTKHPVHHC